MQAVRNRYGFVTGLLVLAAALFSFSAVSPRAGEAEDRAALDTLFEALKDAPDAETAHLIDQQIWLRWTMPSDDLLATRMRAVLMARQMSSIENAISICDQIITDYPEYAEGWNQRATLYYMIGEFEASLDDIDKVLLYEPRHFGALSGQAMIYLQQGKRALALKAMATALKVHPFLDEQRLFPELHRDVTRL
jgi:tetratricopeptide (TPR) repeat protein